MTDKELADLVRLTGLIDRAEGDKAVLLGAFLDLADMTHGDDTMLRWRERGQQEMDAGPVMAQQPEPEPEPITVTGGIPKDGRTAEVPFESYVIKDRPGEPTTATLFGENPYPTVRARVIEPTLYQDPPRYPPPPVRRESDYLKGEVYQTPPVYPLQPVRRATWAELEPTIEPAPKVRRSPSVRRMAFKPEAE